jgi:antitoxin component YwqK of YwqJK toxin-antitoxin module
MKNFIFILVLMTSWSMYSQSTDELFLGCGKAYFVEANEGTELFSTCQEESCLIYVGTRFCDTLRSIAYYQNDVFTGTANYIFEDRLLATYTFKDGLIQQYTAYYRDGKIWVDAQYKDGVHHGTKKEFLEDGSIYSLENYTEGDLNGEYCRRLDRVDYGDGESYFILKGIYVNGKREGTWKMLRDDIENYGCDNGTIYETMTYLNDSLHGEYRMFYPNGNLKEVAHYDHGKITGDYASYRINGTLFYSTTFFNGNGETKALYNDGEWELRQVYENGFAVNR